jgi:glycosyltransferase involved in cell wall biosynthesis
MVATISILMPVYNGIEFLEESVASVLAQTWTDWELLVGINGHEPNSAVYQQAVAQTNGDPRIRVVDFGLTVSNKTVALNALLAMTTGQTVALLDVDDVWLPQKLETQMAVLENYDVVGSLCVYFGERTGMPSLPVGDLTEFPFLKVNPIIHSSAILRKSCFRGWTDEWGIEDYELWLQLQLEGKRMYNCQDILVKHRIHKTSAFNSKGHQHLLPALKHHYALLFACQNNR